MYISINRHLELRHKYYSVADRLSIKAELSWNLQNSGTQSVLKWNISTHFGVNFSILTQKCVGPQSAMWSVTHFGVKPQSVLDPKVRCNKAIKNVNNRSGIFLLKASRSSQAEKSLYDLYSVCIT
jgi:hypothetical protein